MKRTPTAAFAAAMLLIVSSGCEADDCGPHVARVVRVVDGDTLDVRGHGRVRILGIDAPETGGEPGCGGDEAHAFMAARVRDREVTLAYDTACRDRYDRLLAHVTVDGVSVGLALLEAGLACARFLEPNLAHRDEFVRAAQVARAHGLGIWGSCRPLPCE